MSRRWITIASLWGVFGVFYTLLSLTYLRAVGSERSLLSIVVSHALYIAVWIAATPLMLRLASRYRLERQHWPWRLLAHLGLGIVFAFPQRVLTDLLSAPLRPPTAAPLTAEGLLQSALGSLDYGIFLYLLVVFLHHLWEYARRLQEEERHADRLAADLAGARLQALQLQLQPHFLFNTLNAIVVLVRSDPQRAEEMLRHLSEFLRATLEHDGNAEVTLEQELRLLDRYLEIARTRFGERLSIERSVAPETLNARVPYLVLQPLVENALRHGIGSVPGPGTLGILAVRVDGKLRLEVSDSGPGFPQPPARAGVGLENTRRRLESLYGAAHRLIAASEPGRGGRVTIELPFHGEEVTG